MRDDPTQRISLEEIAAREQERFEALTRLRRDKRYREYLAGVRAREASLAPLDATPTVAEREKSDARHAVGIER